MSWLRPQLAQHPQPDHVVLADAGGVDWLPAYRTDTTINVYQLITGLRGDLPFTRDWTWEVYGSHGKTSAERPSSRELSVSAACGATVPSRSIRQKLAEPADHCRHRKVHERAADLQHGWQRQRHRIGVAGLRGLRNPANEQRHLARAGCDRSERAGSLFNIWGGPLQFAAGADYRLSNTPFTPDAAYNANQEFANVVNNIALPLGVHGMTFVKEAYIELAIPVLADLPLIKKLEIDPGYRISDYNTSGTASTWKITADWRLTDWVRFRGGFQHANRAPNVVELFSPSARARSTSTRWMRAATGPVSHPHGATTLRIRIDRTCRFSASTS